MRWNKSMLWAFAGILQKRGEKLWTCLRWSRRIYVIITDPNHLPTVFVIVSSLRRNVTDKTRSERNILYIYISEFSKHVGERGETSKEDRQEVTENDGGS